MPLHESQYGDEKRLPKNSALSGKPLNFGAGDVRMTINGYTIGVKAAEWRNATHEQKVAAKAEWAANLPAAAPTTPLEEPAYDAMSLADLKATAEARGVDIIGRSSKAQIIQALRYTDLQAVSAPTASAETALDVSGMIGE